MSRVNEALKRVSQQDRVERKTAPAPAVVAPVQPSRHPLLPILSGAAILLIAAAGVLVLLRAGHISSLTTTIPSSVAATPAAVPKAAPQSTTQLAATPSIPVAQPAAIAVPVPAAIPASNSPAIPQFPRLKLQAIFFTANSPRALINGSAVGEGDSVAGARVKKIEPDNVALEWNSQRKILRMPNP
jgi:hypothetical protein